jgi:hypothetical protein
MSVEEDFSKGFDVGNYAAAYQTEDYEEVKEWFEGTRAFLDGVLAGFFLSYELHEVSEPYQEAMATCREQYKEWLDG